MVTQVSCNSRILSATNSFKKKGLKSERLILKLALLIALFVSACGSVATPTSQSGPTGQTPLAEATLVQKETTPTEIVLPTPTPPEIIIPTPTEEKHENGLPNLAGRTINIAVENAYLPFNYIELATGEAGGWDYDAWDEICRRLNCTPNYVEARLDGLIEAVSQGEFDVAADGIVILEERTKLVDFSDGYLNVEQRFLVRAEENRFELPEELQADDTLVVGVQRGTSNYNTAEEIVGYDRIQAFETLDLAVQALSAGEVDVVIMDEIGEQGYVGIDADKVKLVGPSLSIDQFGFIYPKGSSLLEPVNLALGAMKADGFLGELAKKYFSDQFTLTYDDIGQGAYADE